MTPATRLAGGQKVHTRETVIQALRDYAATYGEDFTTAAFSPSTAKWRDEPELVERYYKGNPVTGERWPSLNAIKTHAGGSFNRAREMAGFEPNSPGPSKSRRAAGTARPIRDVRERVRVVYHDRPVDQGDVREHAHLASLLAKTEVKLARAGERLHDAREKAKAAQSDRRAAVAREAALSREVDRLRALKPARTEPVVRVLTERVPVEDPKTRRLLDEALGAQDGLRARIAVLEGDIAAAQEVSALHDPAEARAVRQEALEARQRAASSRTEALEAREALNVARSSERAALRARDAALREASDQSRQRVEIQNAVAGHARPLSSAEVADLRAKGPAGGPVFAAAVKRVVKSHGRAEKQAALRDVAAAAIRWSERL